MEKGQIGTYSFYFSSKWSENKYGQKNSMCRSFMIRIHLTFFVVVISKIFFFGYHFSFSKVFFVSKPFLKLLMVKLFFIISDSGRTLIDFDSRVSFISKLLILVTRVRKKFFSAFVTVGSTTNVELWVPPNVIPAIIIISKIAFTEWR